MKYCAPQKLIETIQGHLIKNYLPEKMRRLRRDPTFNKKDLLFFARGAGALSNAFTIGRGTLPKNYFNLKEYRAGYILYFTITNYLKALFCLNEVKDLFGKAGVIRILDIGCGPGTASLAAIDFFEGKKIEIVGVDQNRHILRDAREIVEACSRGVKETPTFAGMTRWDWNAQRSSCSLFDVIFLSNITGELKGIDERVRMINGLFSRSLSSGGIIIIIEPALQKTTRDLMHLRDVLLEKIAELRVVSPCTHNDPCPMLRSNKRDWCHMYLDWERPKIIEDVDRLIGNRKDYLKFSYLIITNRGSRAASRESRVVSSPLISRGKTELLLCGDGLIKRLTELNRDRKNNTKHLDELKRGDLLIV